MNRIKKGDKVLIKDNLKELLNLYYSETYIDYCNEKFQGKIVEIDDVYQCKDNPNNETLFFDKNEWLVVICKCYIIPLNACQLVE